MFSRHGCDRIRLHQKSRGYAFVSTASLSCARKVQIRIGPVLHSVDCDQSSRRTWLTGLLPQLLLYSNESIIYSMCSAVMLTVHFKVCLQMKESLPFPPLPLSLPFALYLREIWVLFSLMQITWLFLREHNVSPTTRTRPFRLQTGFLGFLRCSGEKKRSTVKYLIFVISVISEKPEVKLSLAPQWKPPLFILRPWN